MSRSPEHKSRVATLPATATKLTAAFVSTPFVDSWSTPAGVAAAKLPKNISGGTIPQLYCRMQTVVQQMLHSEYGVPIKSHKRRLISAIPSAFTGGDMVQWLMKNLCTDSKAEAIHVANMLARHGFFFSVEGLGIPVRDDGTLYRFQTIYYWPSQNPSNSDFDYGVYLVKQVLRSKHRIRLLDYELNNLHKLKLRLAKEWRNITDKADESVKIFREQKRVAKVIIGSQEEAYWRLVRPPPGEPIVGDTLLTQHYTERTQWRPEQWTKDSLRTEVHFLQQELKQPRVHMSTALEGLVTYCRRYTDFDPMLTSSLPSNPWVSGDVTLWTIEKSLLEHPTEQQVRKWACSFQDLLTDVTGRYKFESFCKSQYCRENIRFWQACRDLKSIPLVSVEGAVKLIYDEFLQRGSTSEVNVSANVQESVEKDIQSPSRYAFTAAQEQIFTLMQNDIYPRFIKSEEYKAMLKQAIEMGSTGRGFFSRLTSYGARRNKLTVQTRDATGISPNLPQRFTRRQLSISRKLSTSATSSSLDDIYLATSSPSSDFDFTFSKRKSAYTEAFIDAITAPNPQNLPIQDRMKFRRVSAPTTPLNLNHKSAQESGSLEQVYEEEEMRRPQLPILNEPIGGIPMSYSANDLTELLENPELIQPSKWMELGTASVAHQGSSPAAQATNHLVPNGNMPISRSIPYQLSEQKNELLQVPDFGINPSPRVQSFDFESIDKRCSSTESIGSTHST